MVLPVVVLSSGTKTMTSRDACMRTDLSGIVRFSHVNIASAMISGKQMTDLTPRSKGAAITMITTGFPDALTFSSDIADCVHACRFIILVELDGL